MKRELIPGVWGRCGRAITDAQASEMDNVVPLRPIDTLHQGRDSTNPVGRYSILAGKPERSDEVRRIFWRTYAWTVGLTFGCVVILACWPN